MILFNTHKILLARNRVNTPNREDLTVNLTYLRSLERINEILNSVYLTEYFGTFYDSNIRSSWPMPCA